MDKWQFYEAMKQKLQQMNLPQADYERLLVKLDGFVEALLAREEGKP